MGVAKFKGHSSRYRDDISHPVPTKRGKSARGTKTDATLRWVLTAYPHIQTPRPLTLDAPLFGGSRGRGGPLAGPRRPSFRARRRRSLGRGRPTKVPGARWRLADAVEVETRSDGDRTDGTEAGLGDCRPKPSHLTQKCPEDRSWDPTMGSEQLDYRNTCAAPIFRVSNTAFTAPSRGAHGPFIGPVKQTTATERLL